MNKRIKSILIVPTLMLAACSSVDVVNVKQAQELKDYGLVYNLPKTVIRISVEAEKTVFVKGPYADYAEKLLGINKVLTADKIEWSLSGFRIESHPEPDGDRYYLIRSRGKTAIENLSLSPEGFLVGINVQNRFSGKDNETGDALSHGPATDLQFTDLSVKNNFKEVKKTTYKEVKTDSTYKKIPVYHSSNERKTLEEKAEEAANFLVKLRKRRFKLLAGMSDRDPPEGEAINTMITELDKTEEEYVALFTGKKRSEKITRQFTFTPSDILEGKKIVLFRFSKEEGIITQDDTKGRPVAIEVTKAGNTGQIVQMIQNQEKLKEIKKGLYYRVPDNAVVRILDDATVLASKQIPVAQFGAVNVLPAKTFKKEGLVIEFYTEYGSIRSINK
ncbi:MAG: DUF4831 family protein [Bacteroidetes bacterium]|nr:DUF4831 family protein [Bacteroidota bacterium]